MAMLDGVQDMALVASLVSPDGDQGVVALDAAGVYAITCLRTTGRLPTVPPDQSTLPQKATAIQAALVRPLVSTFLTGWHAALGGGTAKPKGQETADLIAGYRFGTAALSARTLLMGLPAGNMVSLRVAVEFGGSIPAQMLFVLPVARLAQSDPATDTSDRTARRRADWQAALHKAVLSSPARLHAVLHRTKLPLEKVRGFGPGTILPLPVDALDGVVLDPAPMGQGLRGRLGQIHGQRAIRLQTDESPAAAPRDPGDQPGSFHDTLSLPEAGAQIDQSAEPDRAMGD